MSGVTLSSARVYELCLALVLALDTPEDLAAAVARGLHGANLTGHDSHGIVRMPAYAQAVAEGRVHTHARAEITSRRGATARVCAHRGWGQPAAHVASATASDIAAQLGVGAVSLQDSPHVGRMADYVEAIAARGQIGMALTNAWAGVAPFGGREKRLGTDPIAFGLPRRDAPPMVVDFATSVVAEGKVKVAFDAGATLAPGLIIDRDGRPTTDPSDYMLGGGALLPAAGHKGYGLGVAIEVLGGALSGIGPAMIAGFVRGNGFFVLALEIDAFTDPTRFHVQVDEMAQLLVDTPTAPGVDRVLLPGELERDTAQRRAREGIPLAAATWGDLRRLAARLGVEVDDA